MQFFLLQNSDDLFSVEPLAPPALRAAEAISANPPVIGEEVAANVISNYRLLQMQENNENDGILLNYKLQKKLLKIIM